MSHNPSDTSAAITPPAPVQPPSDPGSGGSSSGSPVGQQEGGVSEVSDTVTLTAEVAKAYDGFDPAVHAVGPDGQPRMKKGGGFALKRGRKPGGAAEPQPHKVSTIRAPVGADSPGAQISNRQAAGMLCGMTVAGLQMVLGPDWEPRNDQERKALVDGMEEYLNAAGGIEMSPGVGLAFVWGGYGLPRLTMPETQSRLKRFGQWLGGLFKRAPRP